MNKSVYLMPESVTSDFEKICIKDDTNKLTNFKIQQQMELHTEDGYPDEWWYTKGILQFTYNNKIYEIIFNMVHEACEPVNWDICRIDYESKLETRNYIIICDDMYDKPNYFVDLGLSSNCLRLEVKNNWFIAKFENFEFRCNVEHDGYYPHDVSIEIDGKIIFKTYI